MTAHASGARPLPSAAELVEQFRAGRLRPSEALAQVLQKIEATRGTINAFASVDREAAEKAARDSDERWRNGTPLGALDGVPIAPKDVMPVKGQPTRNGSFTTSPEPEPEDAPYIARLRAAGAVLVGRTTTPEYCWTGATHSPVNGLTRNPWKLDRTVGGSSGGAAAAVAAGILPLTIGTDAGGSIRTPAGLCGLVGFKPSFGAVKLHRREGYSTFNSAGPFALTVPDARTTFSIMAGREEQAALSARTDKPLQALRVAFTADMGYARFVSPEIREAVGQAGALCARLGAEVQEAHPQIGWPIDVYNTIGWAEQAHTLGPVVARHRERMDPGLVEIVGVGERITAAEYIAAQKERWLISLQMSDFFERFDVLITPALPMTAFEAGRLSPDSDEVTAMNDWLPFSSIFNMTGQPALTLPCGFDGEGLPFGLQLVGRNGDDWLILDVAEALDDAAGWTDEVRRRAGGICRKSQNLPQ